MTERSAHLAALAESYDSIAAQYTEFVRNELESLPLDRAMLATFAEHIHDSDGGHVAELGCGSGRVTSHLRDLGLDIFGIDLSPALIEIARQNYDDLRFEVGSMDDLDLNDASMSGIVSWYSIVHTPPSELPSFFSEFHRVLNTGGHILLAFFESDNGPVAFDHQVAQAYRWPIDGLAALGNQVGLIEVGRMRREPQKGERFRRGHLLMRK